VDCMNETNYRDLITKTIGYRGYLRRFARHREQYSRLGQELGLDLEKVHGLG